ncbi:hypothetical protein R5W24_004596 [Gemmata sp. JC717]|nr:hypothetical protein [Gemmata algarum]MDY3555453.1 hypothetical protein [Gemmata algarum]
MKRVQPLVTRALTFTRPRRQREHVGQVPLLLRAGEYVTACTSSAVA